MKQNCTDAYLNHTWIASKRVFISNVLPYLVSFVDAKFHKLLINQLKSLVKHEKMTKYHVQVNRQWHKAEWFSHTQYNYTSRNEKWNMHLLSCNSLLPMLLESTKCINECNRHICCRTQNSTCYELSKLLFFSFCSPVKHIVAASFEGWFRVWLCSKSLEGKHM